MPHPFLARFSDRERAMLEELAKSHGKTKNFMVRSAVRLSHTINKAVDEGDEVILRAKDGSEKMLLIVQW